MTKMTSAIEAEKSSIPRPQTYDERKLIYLRSWFFLSLILVDETIDAFVNELKIMPTYVYQVPNDTLTND